MPPAPRAHSHDDGASNTTTVALGVGLGVGLSLIVLLLAGIAVIIWRRHKKAYARKPGELASFAPDKSVPKPVPLAPSQQHGRRVSEQSESERRGLLRPSTDGHLPIWEQRHTMPPLDSLPSQYSILPLDSPPTRYTVPPHDSPPSLPDTPPVGTSESRRVYFRLPSGEYPGPGDDLPDLPPIAETPVQSSTGRYTLRHTSLPPPATAERRLSTAKGNNRASMPATSKMKETSTCDRDAWIDLSKRPDLLPPMFLPSLVHHEQSRSQPLKSLTPPVDAARTSKNTTTIAGLGMFSSNWRENVLKGTKPTTSLSDFATPYSPAQAEGMGGRAPMFMEKVKDEPSPTDDAARLRLQSFASASGSLSTGSMSSEGGLEMRRQLRSSLQFPMAQPLAVPREVERHQPRPSLSFPVPQPLSVPIEGGERARTPRRETWHQGPTLDTFHGDLGLGVRSARGRNSTSGSSTQGTPRARTSSLPTTEK